jgi:hypothetical protein
MLTDDEIRALRDVCKTLTGQTLLVNTQAKTDEIAELATRLLAAEARTKIVEHVAREHGWIIDSNGNCGWVGVGHLKDRIRALEEALRHVIEEIECGKQYDAADIARYALQEQSK